jgi:hypothetical protein
VLDDSTGFSILPMIFVLTQGLKSPGGERKLNSSASAFTRFLQSGSYGKFSV